VGAGIGKTILQADQANAILTATNCGTVEIANLTIQGNYANTTQIGIALKGTNGNVWIHDVEIVDVGWCGIVNDIGATTSGIFERLNVHHLGDFGIQLRSGASNVTIRDSTWSDFASRLYPGHAIYLDDVNGATVTGNTISNLPKGPGGDEISGIKVTRESDSPNTGILVANNTVTNAWACISLPYASNVTVQNNTGTDLLKRGIYFLVGGSNLLVQNNTIDSAPVGYSLWGTAPSGSRLSNNTALNCGTATDMSSSAITQSGNSWN